MPIFEFRCKSCETQFETLMRSADATAACPKCGSDHVNKLISTFSSRVETKLACGAKSTSSCYMGENCHCHES